MLALVVHLLLVLVLLATALALRSASSSRLQAWNWGDTHAAITLAALVAVVDALLLREDVDGLGRDLRPFRSKGASPGRLGLRPGLPAASFASTSSSTAHGTGARLAPVVRFQQRARKTTNAPRQPMPRGLASRASPSETRPAAGRCKTAPRQLPRGCLTHQALNKSNKLRLLISGQVTNTPTRVV